MFNVRKVQESVIFNAVKEASCEATAEDVVYGNELTKEDNPTWVRNTMQRLEDKFDQSTVIKIRRNCQCGYGMDEKLSFVKEILETSTDIEGFANDPRAKAAGLSYKNGELYLQFDYCPCPMLAEVDKLETDTWCQCTTGYSKVLFEKALGYKVDVELIKSIKMEDDICLMKIIPQDPK